MGVGYSQHFDLIAPKCLGDYFSSQFIMVLRFDLVQEAGKTGVGVRVAVSEKDLVIFLGEVVAETKSMVVPVLV